MLAGEPPLRPRRGRPARPRQRGQSGHRVHVRQRDLRPVRPVQAVLHAARQLLDELHHRPAGQHHRGRPPGPHAQPLQRRGLRIGGPDPAARRRGAAGPAAIERPPQRHVHGRDHRPVGTAGRLLAVALAKLRADERAAGAARSSIGRSWKTRPKSSAGSSPTARSRSSTHVYCRFFGAARRVDGRM